MIEIAHTASEGRSPEPVSTKVAVAVAEVKDVEPTELPPLYRRIDPEALDRLFQPRGAARPPVEGHVAFTLAGCDVVVDSDGQVTVTPADSSTEGGPTS